VRAGTGLRGAEHLAGIGRAGGDQELLGEEPGGLFTDTRELPEHQRRPEHIGKSGGLVIGEGDGVDGFVRVVDAEQCELSLTRPM